jgi:hypothetical protein
VPEVQIGGGRVHAELDAQRAAAFELFDEFSLNQQFVAAAPYRFELFYGGLHRAVPELGRRVIFLLEFAI